MHPIAALIAVLAVAACTLAATLIQLAPYL